MRTRWYLASQALADLLLAARAMRTQTRAEVETAVAAATAFDETKDPERVR